MHELHSSRRTVMRALIIAPSLIATPIAASAATGLVCNPTGISEGMAAAIKAYREASARCDKFSTDVYGPAWEAWRAEVDAIPHFTTKASFKGWATFDHLTTADRGMVAMAKKIVETAKPGHFRDYELAAAELVEAEGRREAQSKQLSRRYNVSALAEEDDRLGDIRDDLLTEIEEFPVATIADLIAKVEIIEETQGQIEPVDLLADLRRIAGEA